MSGFLKEYNILAQNTVIICAYLFLFVSVCGIITVIICAYLFLFVSVCGIIRFKIAIKRRKSGVYPPSSAQMED